MTGEELFNLLKKMAERGDPPRKREKTLKKIAEKEGLSSDALRAKARRWAKANNGSYPLMRKPATKNRSEERERQRAERKKWREQRLKDGEAAVARGADWTEIAKIFGIKTAEGAAQWWRRNHDGLKGGAAKKGKKRGKK
ncbi:MAG: hypothetical protein FJ102_16000 [Deltaproteobacteria bacterium]|nr:hypothetical protein [Deltaproteobacteria bacterium]